MAVGLPIPEVDTTPASDIPTDDFLERSTLHSETESLVKGSKTTVTRNGVTTTCWEDSNLVVRCESHAVENEEKASADDVASASCNKATASVKYPEEDLQSSSDGAAVAPLDESGVLSGVASSTEEREGKHESEDSSADVQDHVLQQVLEELGFDGRVTSDESEGSGNIERKASSAKIDLKLASIEISSGSKQSNTQVNSDINKNCDVTIDDDPVTSTQTKEKTQQHTDSFEDSSADELVTSHDTL